MRGVEEEGLIAINRGRSKKKKKEVTFCVVSFLYDILEIAKCRRREPITN